MCFKCVFLSETEVMAYYNPSLGGDLKRVPAEVEGDAPPSPPVHRRRQMEALWEAAVNTDLEARLRV